MTRTFLVVLNTITFAAVILVNIISGYGDLSDNTVGEVSRKYNSLFAPAGYAFSIWGLIYLMLAGFIGFQWYALFSRKYSEIIDKTSWYFIMSNLANVLWLVCWLNELIGLSVILMFILLWSLIMLVLKHDMEIKDAALPVLVFTWWPISLYTGWIVTATVANIAAYLNIYWDGYPLSPQLWTIIMIIIAAIIYILLILKRNMREAAFAGIWALSAIAVRNWENENEIAYTALAAAIILFIYCAYEAYKNRHTLPYVRKLFGN